LLADASVARNFAVLGWTDELITLAGGSLFIAHGVLGMDCDEVGEIERMRSPGSPMASAATAALVGLDDLIRRRSKDVTVLAPTEVEMAVAIRLQDPREGTWRRSLGVRARRLDAGEAVSIAIATVRGLTFASDDDDGRAAYEALAGIRHRWTLDLVQEAVAQGLLTDTDARRGYRLLRERYRFWGQPWPLDD
jgi:predicted nucleic acid-binding protein